MQGRPFHLHRHLPLSRPSVLPSFLLSHAARNSRSKPPNPNFGTYRLSFSTPILSFFGLFLMVFKIKNLNPCYTQWILFPTFSSSCFITIVIFFFWFSLVWNENEFRDLLLNSYPLVKIDASNFSLSDSIPFHTFGKVENAFHSTITLVKIHKTSQCHF
jgi:hypothetical protein